MAAGLSRLDRFWKTIDDGQVVRRIAFFGMMYLTYVSYSWAMAYISSITQITVDHGLVIGAVLGPISGLQGAVIKFYAENPYHFSHRGVRIEPKTTVIMPSNNEEQWRD